MTDPATATHSGHPHGELVCAWCYAAGERFADAEYRSSMSNLLAAGRNLRAVLAADDPDGYDGDDPLVYAAREVLAILSQYSGTSEGS